MFITGIMKILCCLCFTVDTIRQPGIYETRSDLFSIFNKLQRRSCTRCELILSACPLAFLFQVLFDSFHLVSRVFLYVYLLHFHPAAFILTIRHFLFFKCRSFIKYWRIFLYKISFSVKA